MKVKLSIITKFITMINTILGRLEIIQYGNKKEKMIVNLVETMCLARYPWPKEIKYDR